jgi:copper chaperone CopZ
MKARQKSVEQSMQRTTERFSVEALDCSACGADLRVSLRELRGIQAVAVNVPAREIAVTFDPSRVDPDAIRLKLDSLGLGCSS